MADPVISTLNLNSLISGGAVFLVVFLALLFAWSIIIRTLHSVFGKSRFFFIPKTLKELFLSIAFVFLLLSVYFSVLFVVEPLLKHDIFKVWQILFIFALINIVLRVVLTGLDVHYRKAKDKSGIFRSIGLVKGTIGLVLYFIAILFSINIISEGLGTLLTALVFFIFILIFFAAFDPIKSIVAGLQLGDYYVEHGKLIRVRGKLGFIDSVHGRSTLVKTIDGETLVIPNYVFFKEIFEIGSYDEMNELSVYVEVVGKKSEKIRERLSAISSKITMSTKEIPHEYKPKIFLRSMNEGAYAFSISMKVLPDSDIRKIMDIFVKEFSEEFGSDLRNVCLK
jgi:small-conductance mechanosensitive channel